MKKFKTLLVAVPFIAFLSCSKTNGPSIDEELLLNDQTRSETTESSGGMTVIINDNREKIVIPPIFIYPIQEENDTIANEELPNDSIPNDSIPNDSTRNKQKNIF